jgi:cytochrome oxidase Cu insertion factor (SCO1/SenC/PrrC family)
VHRPHRAAQQPSIADDLLPGAFFVCQESNGKELKMRKIMIGILLSACWLGLSAANGLAQTTTPLGPKDGANLPPADLERIKVGAAAPDFTLLDQDGQAVTLSSYRGKKPVVLVFYRGYW